eukprot:2484303-Pleurochrysis_carterae.AAC.1
MARSRAATTSAIAVSSSPAGRSSVNGSAPPCVSRPWRVPACAVSPSLSGAARFRAGPPPVIAPASSKSRVRDVLG